MNLREAVRIALAMIRSNKLRAFFTVLGTVVGVTFLIAVITMIEGMNAYMENEFAGKIFGYNTVTVRRIPSMGGGPGDEETWRSWQRRPRITIDDAEYIAARMETPGVLAYSSDQNGKISDGRGHEVTGVNVTGASASFFSIRDLKVEEGRPFSPNEAQRGVPVVVLGRDVADKLFEGASPVGRQVRIHNFPYRVIGILERQGTLFGFSMDKVAIAPIRAPLNGALNMYNIAEDVSFKVEDGALLPSAMSEIEGLMRSRRHLRPGEESDFAVETAEAALGFWQKISSFMLKVLPGLVGISLVVGAVVIMNIMLVSVSERTREIGVRKSLGARRRDILLQFLIEAGTLSGAGGVLGIGLGAGLAGLIAAVSPMPARVAPYSIALAIGLGVGVGLLAGVYPAYRASRLDPIVALRKE